VGRVRPRPPLVRSRAPLSYRLTADRRAVRSWVLAAAGTALLVAGGVRSVSAGEAAQHRWGRRVPVLVADRAVKRGQPLAGRVRVASWPAALVPTGALHGTGRLRPGATAAGPLARGTPVTTVGVAPRPRTRTATDRRRIAIPRGNGALPVRRGDEVDVWATTDPSLANGALTTRPVAHAAIVAAVSDRTVVVAVRSSDVAAVATAVATATVTLVGG
jgi:hypothetical protein